MKKEDTKKEKEEHHRSALAGWDNEGGSVPSDRELKIETEREDSSDRAAKQSAFDTTHDSSARGEHRYPDAHQTEGEQKARDARDALKRKLGGTR
jgi:hypothetical protein